MIYDGATVRRISVSAMYLRMRSFRILAASSKSLLGFGANACTIIVFDEVGAAAAQGRAVFDALLTESGQAVVGQSA